MVENIDGQTNRQGLFSPLSDGTNYNGVPVYKQIGGNQQMWFRDGWRIGSDYTINLYGIYSSVRMQMFQCDGIFLFIFERIGTTAQKMFQHGSTGMGVQWLWTKMLTLDAVTVPSTQNKMNAVIVVVLLW